MRLVHRVVSLSITAVLIVPACSSEPSEDGRRSSESTVPALTTAHEDGATTPSSVSPTTAVTPGAAQPTGDASGVVPPPVPDPPGAAPIPDGDALGQATALAEASEPGSPGGDAAWLTAYELAGIPVFAADGAPLGGTGDDPLGPNWWQVWMLTDTTPGQGIWLSDAIKIVVSPDDRAATEEEAAEATLAFLDDLRAARQSADPAARFAAEFIDAKARQAGTPLSLFDPSVDLTTTNIDPATASFLVWASLRSVAVTLIAEPDGVSGFRSAVPAPSRAASGAPCNQLFGSEQTTTTVNWIVGKVGGGVSVPGLNVPGLISALKQLSPGVVSEARLAKFNRVASRINALTSVASALMQYAAMQADGVGDTLDRTRTTEDGDWVTLRFDVYVDPGRMPDGNNRALCALSFLFNAAGITFNFPAEGPSGGVELVFTGKDGFGERVYFDDAANQMKQVTDSEGSADVEVVGKRHEDEISAGSPRVPAEYTIEIEATPEPINGNSIFNTLFDSLSFHVDKNPLALLSVILDILKTTHWDLGDKIFPLQDWIGDWSNDEPIPGGKHSGEHCGGIDGEWVLTSTYELLGGKGSQMWVIQIDPDTLTGTFIYSDMQTNEQAGVKVELTGEASGTAKVSFDDAGVVTMRLQETEHRAEAKAPGGTGYSIGADLASYEHVWQVGADCDAEP